MGLNIRLMKLSANFQHLNKNELIDAYKMADRRLLFLDFEGTIQENDYGPSGKPTPAPSQRLLKLLTSLSNDPQNTIFIVSGREKKYLNEWFSSKI